MTYAGLKLTPKYLILASKYVLNAQTILHTMKNEGSAELNAILHPYLTSILWIVQVAVLIIIRIRQRIRASCARTTVHHVNQHLMNGRLTVLDARLQL